jgi:hypothetical protein
MLVALAQAKISPTLQDRFPGGRISLTAEPGKMYLKIG